MDAEFRIPVAKTKWLVFEFPKADGETCEIRVPLFRASEEFVALEPRKAEPGFWEVVATRIKAWSDCDCCTISEQQAFDVWQAVSELNAADAEERKKKAPTFAPSPIGTEASTLANGTSETSEPG